MGSIKKLVRQLSPEQYLPSTGNVSNPSMAWSISLNLALWLKIECVLVQTTSLYVEYQDVRGKQQLLVDSQLVEGESEILFSNLVKIPIKGPLISVSLSLSYKTPEFKFAVDELFVRVIEPPQPDPQLRKTG